MVNKKKLNIIIPIRDREIHLASLLKNLNKMFSIQNVVPYYCVVEQESGREFNKGYLLNIGFKFMDRVNRINDFLFSDVDVFCRKHKKFNYNFFLSDKVIYHPYGERHCISPFFFVNKYSFKLINGFSNEYYGWGYEDTDLQRRANMKLVNINRDNFRERGHEIFYDHDYDANKIGLKMTLPDTIKNKALFDENRALELSGVQCINIDDNIKKIEVSSNLFRLMVSIN